MVKLSVALSGVELKNVRSWVMESSRDFSSRIVAMLKKILDWGRLWGGGGQE